MQCCATNTLVPGPPELPGDGPGWFSQMRAARLEMRDERTGERTDERSGERREER